MRRGEVFYQDIKAGVIEQDDGVFRFTYEAEYLALKAPKALSLLLPLQSKPFEEKTMIPFFDGLIPEGWLLNLAEKNWKIDRKDRMGLLLNTCDDTIGAVTVRNVSEA